MKNVGIICGGFSSEFNISMKSAENIKRNFPDNYATYLIVLSDKGWHASINNELVPINIMDLSFNDGDESIKIDLAIVYIHGDPGENGKVQAFLDIIGVPYLNSGALASELSFDKWFCNQFLRGFDIKVAASVHLLQNDERPSPEEVESKLGMPVFVKPCDSGSSYGIAKVKDVANLNKAIDEAFLEGDTVVIEEFLDGTEVTCGVYRSEKEIVALPLTEIVSQNDFFDFQAKYEGLSEEITPARINDELANSIQELSKRIYQLLQLKSITRIDYMVVKGVPYVIEVNTTPGFSNESIVPKMVGVAGMSVTQLWQEILKGEGF